MTTTNQAAVNAYTVYCTVVIPVRVLAIDPEDAAARAEAFIALIPFDTELRDAAVNYEGPA